MARTAISDQHVVRVLRPFVAATGPILRELRDADPLRLGRLAERRARQHDEERTRPRDTAPRTRRAAIARHARGGKDRILDRLATSRLPGTPRWQTMTTEERDHWWVARVGRFTSAVASFPGIGGALAKRLPVSDILGLAAQGLVVCAIADDHGVTGRDDQVRLLASVLFSRDVDPARQGEDHDADVEREAGELSGAVAHCDGRRDERGRLASLARAVWRMGRALFELDSELDRRPRGRRGWRLAANLPVVGALATYRSERSGLKEAASRTVAVLERERER